MQHLHAEIAYLTLQLLTRICRLRTFGLCCESAVRTMTHLQIQKKCQISNRIRNESALLQSTADVHAVTETAAHVAGYMLSLPLPQSITSMRPCPVLTHAPWRPA